MNQETIINKAMLRCGLPLTAALEDCDWNAAFIFETSAEEVLRQFTWSFARKITSLQVATTQIPGWGKTYFLPTDYLRVVDVHACSDMRAPKARYELVGNNLCANVSPCILRYVSKTTPVESYPVDFADVVALRIAVEISSLSAQTMGMVPQLTQLYELSLAKAQATDARENADRVPLDHNILLSRGGIEEGVGSRRR